MASKIETTFSVGLPQETLLRWKRYCARKNVKVTTRIRETLEDKLRTEREPKIKPGTDVAAELAKFSRR